MVTIELIVDGSCFTVYAIEMGDEYDFSAAAEDFSSSMPAEWHKMVRRIDYFAEYGDPHDPRKCESLGDGLFAFKTIAKKGGVLRSIFFYNKGNVVKGIVICTHTFFKNTLKMPPG